MGKFLWVTLHNQYLPKSSSSAYIKQSHILAWDMGVICFMSCHNKADRPEKSFPALFAYRTWRGIFRTVTVIKLFVSHLVKKSASVCPPSDVAAQQRQKEPVIRRSWRQNVMFTFMLTSQRHCVPWNCIIAALNVSMRCQLFTNELAVSLHVQYTPIKGFFL